MSDDVHDTQGSPVAEVVTPSETPTTDVSNPVDERTPPLPLEAGVLEEPSIVTDPRLPKMPLSSGPQETRLREELERMLVTAETLQKECDRLQNRVQYVSLIGFTIIFACLGVGFYYAATMDKWSVMYLVGAFVIVGSIVVAAFQNVPKRSLTRDQRALASIVQLLRETETAYMYAGTLSTFEIAQYRIRLSRFDIGHPGLVVQSRRAG